MNVFSLSLLLLTIPVLVDAQQLQWESLHGPYGGDVGGLATLEPDAAFASWYGGVLYSADRGASWISRVNGLRVDPKAVRNGQLGFGVFSITAHVTSGTLLLAADAGIFRSTDRGATWWFDDSSVTVPRATIVATGLDSVVFASDYEGVVRSTNLGRSWDTMLGRSATPSIQVVADTASRILYMRRGTMILRSPDLGVTWADATDSLSGGGQPTLLLGGDRSLLAYGMSVGLRRSTDGGATWADAGSGIDRRIAAATTLASGSLVAVDSLGGVFASDNNGLRFRRISEVSAHMVELTSVDDNHLLARTTDAGLLRSTDAGVTWQDANVGVIATAVNAVAATKDGAVIAGTTNGIHTFTSTAGWRRATEPSARRRSARSIISTSAGAVLAGTTAGVLRSSDDGRTWDTTFSVDLAQAQNEVWELDETAWGDIYGGTFNGLLRSTDDGRRWYNAGLGGLPVQALASRHDGTMIAASGSFFYAGLRRSIDRGWSWGDASNGVTSRGVSDLAFTPDGSAIAATVDGLFRSADAGVTWLRVDSGSSPARYVAVILVPRGPLVAANHDDLYVSSDGGATWRREDFEPSNPILSLSADSMGRLIIGTYGAGTFRSRASLASTPLSQTDAACIEALSVRPQPATASATVIVRTCNARSVRVCLLDPLGREQPVISASTNGGDVAIPLELAHLSAGVYQVVVQTGTERRSTLLHVIR